MKNSSCRSLLRGNFVQHPRPPPFPTQFRCIHCVPSLLVVRPLARQWVGARARIARSAHVLASVQVPASQRIITDRTGVYELCGFLIHSGKKQQQRVPPPIYPSSTRTSAARGIQQNCRHGGGGVPHSLSSPPHPLPSRSLPCAPPLPLSLPSPHVDRPWPH